MPYCLPTRSSSARWVEVHRLRRAQHGAGETALEVRPQIEDELGLRSIALQDLLDRLDPSQRLIEDLGADPSFERLGAEERQPLLKRRG